MNPDRNAEHLLDDVFRENHDALRDDSLQRMLMEGRRIKRAKRHIRHASIVATLLVIAGIGLFKPRMQPGEAVTNISSAGERAPRQLTVRQLTDAELQHRLETFAVAYVGKAADRRIVMIAPRTP